MKLQTAATAMSSITPAAIEEKLTVASPLSIINTLPGANFGSSDAYGLSIRNFLSIRGLDQTEIGYLVDNMPPVSITNYFPYAETWADNENVADLTIIQGNSRLQDPIINASGGELIMTIRSPKNQFGGKLSASAGSYEGSRIFGAIDTGYIGETGAKAFASYSHSTAHNFVGPGRNNRDHVDLRIEKDWSDNARSTLYAAYDDLYNARLPFFNLAQANDGINNDRLDQYMFSSSYVPGVTTQYYKLNVSLSKGFLVSNNNDIKVSDNVTLHVIPYYRFYQNKSSSQSRLNPTSIFSGNTKVVAAFDPSVLQGGGLVGAGAGRYDQNIFGVNNYVEAKLSSTNSLSFGYWFQQSLLDEYQGFQLVDQQGNLPGYNRSTALKTTSGAFISGLDYSVRTTNHQVFIGDTQSFLDDRLSVTLGFKYLIWKTHVNNYAIGAPLTSSTSWTRAMPRILASFKFDDRNQIYANITTNARMPIPKTTYVNAYNISSGAATAVGNSSIKPEYTVSSQAGYRFSGPINIDATAFLMKLKNHQITGTSFVNGFLLSTSINGGDFTIKGVSLEAATRSYRGFSVYGNTQYLDARADDNIPLRGDLLRTAGKKLVSAPEWITNLGARYEIGGFYSSITWKRVGSQFSTFVNDQSIPAIETFDAGIGYKFPDRGPLKSPTVRVSATNLGNKSYIASIPTPTANAVATTGVNGTVMPAAVPMYYVGANRAVMLTLTTEF